MLRLTALAVCVLFTLSATGQHRKHTVVLNDGSRISGTIVSDSSGYLDVKVLTPQIIRINRLQVASLEDLKYPVKKNQKTGGYYIRFATGTLTGKNENDNRLGTLSFHLSNGYQFRNGIGIGIGSGMEEFGVVVVPLYGEILYTPFTTKISPYAWLKSGYGFATADPEAIYYDYSAQDVKSVGGFLFSTGAGISMFTWQRTALNVGIGYRYQKVILRQNQSWWGGYSVRETVTYSNRLEIHLAFVFR